MNTKLQKLKEEYAKNERRINSLQQKNEKIAEQIDRMESESILGLVRAYRLTPEALAELLKNLKVNPLPVDLSPDHPYEMEEDEPLEEN